MVILEYNLTNSVHGGFQDLSAGQCGLRSQNKIIHVVSSIIYLSHNDKMLFS